MSTTRKKIRPIGFSCANRRMKALNEPVYIALDNIADFLRRINDSKAEGFYDMGRYCFTTQLMLGIDGICDPINSVVSLVGVSKKHGETIAMLSILRADFNDGLNFVKIGALSSKNKIDDKNNKTN